jgi:hypothetical protein
MKKKGYFTIGVVLILLLLGFCLAFAEQKTINLPKGTTVEKLGWGHFKFKLPNRQIIEVKNFDPKTGAIGYVGIIDPQPPGKPVTSGKQGQFKGAAKSKPVRVPPRTEYVQIDEDIVWLKAGSKVPQSDYIMIDEDVVWLPATIQFQPEAKGTRGLSPQPDPPGRR